MECKNTELFFCKGNSSKFFNSAGPIIVITNPCSGKAAADNT